MKKKIVFALVLSALLLAGCDRGEQLVDELEPTNTTASTSTEQAVQTVVVPPENGETTFVFGGTAEETTTAAVTAVTETETAATEFVIENASLEYERLSLDGLLGENFYNGMFISGNIAAISCYGENGKTIRFFDIDDMSVKADISAPEGWEFDGGYTPCVEGGGEVLCKIPLSYFDEETLTEQYAALTVYNDFTTELGILSLSVGEHNISDQMYDIVDTDSGEVLVEGTEDTENEAGFGNMSMWYDYRFSIDGERFVYRACGNERMPGFGYYDFSTGTATNFHNSRNLLPIGYKGGKIYAKETAWDGMCQGELYTFDMETEEKAHFMSSPVTVEPNDYVEYFMPQSGDYIAANYLDDDGSKNTVFIISPESGEVLAQSEVEARNMDFDLLFIDGSRFAAYDGSANEIIVFTVNY